MDGRIEQGAARRRRARLIAHRPFRDEHETADFNPGCLSGFDGVELDLRSHGDGPTTVFHAPMLTHRRRPTPKRPPKSLEAVFQQLSRADQAVDFFLLDVKTHAAAQRLPETLKLIDPSAEVVFLCWHPADVASVLAIRPEAKVFWGMAPLPDPRLIRWLPSDFILFNGFPFVASRRRFRPRARQYNQHNIHVRRAKAPTLTQNLPAGVSGICFHKVFYRPTLATAAHREGLEIAVYGFLSQSDPKIAEIAERVDYTIVDPSFDHLREKTPRQRWWRRKLTSK